MKKILLISALMFTISMSTQAKIRFGVRGGYNIAKMYFDNNILSSENIHGYYLGPTMKIDLPLGFDIDASALFNQTAVVTDLYKTSDSGFFEDDGPLILRRKTFALPFNLRKGFGFGDNLSVFVFAGPQFDFSLNKNISEDAYDWTWSDSMASINIGAGAMFFNHLELKVNYNIPCGKTGEFKINDVEQHYEAKTGVWQIGAAIYF